MATQEEKELRQKVLEDIRRKRAAAAQAEGVVGAAEEGQYGDVGQGEERMDFLATPFAPAAKIPVGTGAV